MTPPGWYQDPTRPTGELLRWWDGTVWTDHTCANPAATVQQPQAVAPPAAPPAPPAPPAPTKASGWLSGVVDHVAQAAKSLAVNSGEPGPEEFANRYASIAAPAPAPAKTRSTWIPPFALLALLASVFLAAFGKSAAIGIALAAVAVAIGLINRWRIVDTPAVPIAAVYPGVCEVVGTTRTPPGVTLRALGTGRECCWWSAELERCDHDDEGDHWTTIWRTGSGNVPFELWDEADDAAVLVESSATPLAVTTVNDTPSPNRRFVERLVPIGTTTYAQGPVQFYDGRPTMTSRRPPDAPTTRSTAAIVAPGDEAEARAASLRGVWILGAILVVWVGVAVAQAMVAPLTLPMTVVVAEVVGLLVGGAVLTGVRLRNRLVEVKWRIVEADALISTFARRRHDLIGQLAATANAAAEHERQIVVSVTEARGSEQVIEGDAPARAQVLARAQASPQLKADAAFVNLFHELVRCENQIAGARTHYNNAIQVAEAHAGQFPTSLLASSILGEIPPRFSAPSIAATQVDATTAGAARVGAAAS